MQEIRSLPSLPHDVRVLHARHDVAMEHVWLDLLSADERSRLEGYRHVKRRQSFLLGRAVARTLVGEHLGVDPRDVPLHVADDGAVDVAGSHLELSISHTDRYAIAAISETTLGADLERIAPCRADLYRYILHPDEYPVMETVPLDNVRTHILLWAVKESVLKGLRTGFRVSPKRLRLGVDYEGHSAVVSDHEGRSWRAVYTEVEGCYLSVALPDEAAPRQR